MNTRVFALLLALFACASTPAAAQAPRTGIVFAGIRWGTPEDSVRARLESLDYRFRQKDNDGDHSYQRADGAAVSATMRAGRLLAFNVTEPARGAEAADRYRVLTDSLRTALGAPDEVQDSVNKWMTWNDGLTSVVASMIGPGTFREVTVGWRGPGYFDETARREKWSPAPAGFTNVSFSPFMVIQVDTSRGAAGAQRFRIQYPRPIRPTIAGVEQAQMDAAEYEMEVDCAGKRTRLTGRTTYLLGAVVDSVRPRGQPWTVPQENGTYARGRDAICRVRRQRP